MAQAADEAQNYHASSLPTLPGYNNTQAYAVNASGQIVGVSGGFTALMWGSTSADPPTPLQTGSFSGAIARGINASGQIVGNGFTDAGGSPAIFWSNSLAAPTPLSRGVFDDVEAQDINSTGQIVGWGLSEAGDVAVIWQSPTAAPSPLPSGVFSFIEARGINDAGQIVGTGHSESTGSVALYWASPTADPVQLVSDGFISANAEGINDSGQIVGSVSTGFGGDGGAFFWASPTATPTALADPTHNQPFGISDSGLIVGHNTNHGRAAYWPSPSGTPAELPVGFESTNARGINDSGQIVGEGFKQSTTIALFWPNARTVPTPLPAGGFAAIPLDINNAGQIVGKGFSSATGPVALIWASPTSAPTPLPKGSFSVTEATAINDSGQIVGSASTGTDGAAVFWANPSASPTTLAEGGFGRVRAHGINNAGQIVGHIVSSVRFVALLWETPSASPTPLPAGSMSGGVEAYGINDLGQIVGRGSSRNFGLVPVVWASPTGVPLVLPLGSGTIAVGNNNAGVIVGLGAIIWRPTQTTAAFLHAQGTSLLLNANAPTNTTARSRDSDAVQFAKGNPWKTIGTWSQSVGSSSRMLTGLGDLHAWLGLKDKGDKGARFDLGAEVLKNGDVVSTGESYCIDGLTLNPADALDTPVAFNFFPTNDIIFNANDTLSLRISTRIGTFGDNTFCGGHKGAAGLRLYFDAASRPAGFATTTAAP
ncbi:hypothetical protein [Arthrobacter sp. ISL-5]|uniref:hypothetical protein n=1 Tax=Arthrobacter sp. ISL-5 TaxID=2819111 RepID=UPI001BE76B3D|nr:hypothetical protein [Arthrobacter sp. ISL-5]MBT2555992.1 hypothetical protein [Arthrobacter sp. ISL-5]